MNARKELLELLEILPLIKCAKIVLGDEAYSENIKTVTLKTDYSDDELHEFLDSLDFIYDSGYGAQKLFGVVWLDDGSWLERAEYDGSEWWVHKKFPPIPDELNHASD